MSNERAVLHVLNLSRGRAMRLTVIVVEVQSFAKHALTTAEVQATLDRLEGKHQVVTVRGEDEVLKAKITDDGVARLQEGA